MVLGLVWFVVSEKRGKQESLNHYRIIMDMHNVANQKALHELQPYHPQHRFSGEVMNFSN